MKQRRASSFTSWFVPYGVSRLDDRDNSRQLEELAPSVGGALYAAIDLPELLSPFGNLQRAYVIHARWVEFARHGLRACVVTNIGSPGRGRVATVVPSQVVAVFLPGAAVGHLLEPAPVWSTPDPYPHIVLSARSTSSRMTEAVTAGFPIDPRFWHSRDGQFATELTGSHGYRFASCIDGVLYARSEARKLDLPSALAALDEVVEVAGNRWSPPTESEIARQRALSMAYLDRSRRVRKIAWIAFVGYAVGGGLISWCLLHGR